MKKNIKLFERRKEIINKLEDEVKEDIVKFLLENPLNTIDFTSNINIRASEEYHREKIEKIITKGDLTNEELKDLYFSKEYNCKFFDEVIYENFFKEKIFIKPSKTSDFDNFYKKKHRLLSNFLDIFFEIKREKDVSYYESYNKFLKTLSLEEVFEKAKEKKCNIYYGYTINYYDVKYERIKNVDDLMEIIFDELNKLHKKEINNIQNCFFTFYKELNNKIVEIEFEEKEKHSSNPFGYRRLSNEILANKIKNMKKIDFSNYLYGL